MSEVRPQVKRIYVVPGDVVAEGDYSLGGNVIKQGKKIVSTRIGMAEVSKDSVRVIPLSGPYIPKVDDLVIGKVVDYSALGWQLDINSCFFAYLPAQNVFGKEFSPTDDSLPKKYGIGDLLAVKIAAFDRSRDPLLTINGPGLGKIPKGEIIKMSPTKVPRLIGRKGSMVRTIVAHTNCRLIVGQNGIIAVIGHPKGVLKVAQVIRLIEREAHTAGLTEKVEAMLKEEGD